MRLEATHHPRPGALTRRGALLAAAAAAAAALAPGRLLARASAAAGPALDPRRAAVYRELVRVLGDAPDRRFARRPAGAATRAFAAWYAGQDDAVRTHVDAVLDHAGAACGTACAGLRRAQPAQDAAVLAAAVGLAAVACDPPPGEDERPDLPALGVPA